MCMYVYRRGGGEELAPDFSGSGSHLKGSGEGSDLKGPNQLISDVQELRKMRPYYVALHQLFSVGFDHTCFTLFAHIDKKQQRMFFKFRCPHSMRKKKSKTFVVAVVELKAQEEKKQSEADNLMEHEEVIENEILKILGAYCDCQAGLGGYCWHIAALWLFIIFIAKRDIDIEASTDGGRGWSKQVHVKNIPFKIELPAAVALAKRASQDYRPSTAEGLVKRERNSSNSTLGMNTDLVELTADAESAWAEFTSEVSSINLNNSFNCHWSAEQRRQEGFYRPRDSNRLDGSNIKPMFGDDQYELPTASSDVSLETKLNTTTTVSLIKRPGRKYNAQQKLKNKQTRQARLKRKSLEDKEKNKTKKRKV